MGKLLSIFVVFISIYSTSVALELSKKFHFTPFAGYFMFDKQRHIDSGVGGGINFGYFTSENFGIDVLFGFLSTKHFENKRTVFALSLSFIKLFNFPKKENAKFYITYGFGGNKNVGFTFGLTGGIGLKYFLKEKESFAIDFSGRGFYLWNGRLDGIITAGITYLFK